ncbi:MAG: energy transducer TonB [Terriglobales bacterium]
MEIPAKKIVQLLVEHDPASPEFRNGVRATLHPRSAAPLRAREFDLWKDVFVEQKLPWERFVESALLHACALVLIWTLSLVWLRQPRILTAALFDRSSLITYSPEEYLPPLDTGTAEAPKPQRGEPTFAKQAILSVPREADNRSQTIVVPPDLKLDHDVPLPNMVATGAVAPMVPLKATSSLSNRTSSKRMAPDLQVVAPAPEVDFARDRMTQASLKADIIPPPPEVKRDHTRGMAGPETAVIAPPPELTMPAKGRVGPINVAPTAAVAPAPQLVVAEQHALYGRGQGGGKDLLPASQPPVAPPPSVPGNAGAGGTEGRLVALGIHPVVPTGPVAVPAGNRRGTFEASPQGKAGAAGSPDMAGVQSSKDGANDGSRLKGRNGSLPAGLHIGAAAGPTGSRERDGGSSGDGERREMATGDVGREVAGRRSASALSEDKVTDVDRQVFGDRRPYGTTLNMPNLNSSTGSWVMHFAELEPDPNQGDLVQPLPTEKSDPGYPLELIRANVHGTVTLYAVIHADGGLDGIRVLSSPDDRLNGWAMGALSEWKFLPALRAGKPVAVEAVVEIPFRVRKAF